MFTQDVILENVLVCLRDMIPGAETVGPDSDMVDDLGLESVKMMDLLMKLEDDYDLSIPINILMDVRTPRQLAASLIGYLEKRNGPV
ncbi:acyl carrier protein [Pseudomonas bohemica]|uniref:acyl carrier protein n=1 Tax=Pseudomonas bohemica TaxID=2044872 RepID=UPI000DA613AF|nr:acyl carrier protein [Pseudomonas bohemica]